MKKRPSEIVKKFLLLAMMISLISPFFARSVNAETMALNVNPSTLEVNVGEKFTVAINVTDVPEPGLYAYQLKLYYNNTLLQGISVEIPDNHFLKPETPSNIFIVDRSINQTEGYVSIAVTLMGTEPGKTGSGILANVEFNGTEQGTANLVLDEVILVDGDGNTISSDQYTLNGGTVTIIIPEFTFLIITISTLVVTLVLIGFLFHYAWNFYKANERIRDFIVQELRQSLVADFTIADLGIGIRKNIEKNSCRKSKIPNNRIIMKESYGSIKPFIPFRTSVSYRRRY